MINRLNYLRIKEFLNHKRASKQLKDTSIERYYSYLVHLITWAQETPLSRVNSISPTFIEYLANYRTSPHGRPLARETWKKILGVSTQFFEWAKRYHAKEFSSVDSEFIDSLTIPKRVPESHKRDYVSFEEMANIASIIIPEENLALKRDQAAAVFLYLTGIRAGAFLTMPLKAVDTKLRRIYQWPEYGVHTKNNKRATTILLGIPELMPVVQGWDQYVRSHLTPDDLWFPRIDNQWGVQSLSKKPPGHSRNQRLNKRLRVLAESAGVPYKSAHCFRHGHTMYGLERAQSIDIYKAVSENLMHSDIVITDRFYSSYNIDDRQRKLDSITSSNHHPSGQYLELSGLSTEEIGQKLIEMGKHIQRSSIKDANYPPG